MLTNLSFCRPIGPDLQTGDFITETWFMALLISMVTVMVFLFGAMLFVRRRQMLSKKGMPSSRSNGAVLSTPIGSKHETPLWLDKETPPDYTSTLPEYAKLTQDYSGRPAYSSLNGGPHGINLHTNPLHQKEFSRPNCLGYNADNTSNSYKADASLKDFCSMQVQDYASPNIDSNRTSQLADYAEVDASMMGTQNGAVSPAPYATTTLVTASRRNGNSLVSQKHLLDCLDYLLLTLL